MRTPLLFSLPIGRLLHIEIDMNGDVEAQQREYIEYLEELKGRILASRSWRYTAPLRALNLLR